MPPEPNGNNVYRRKQREDSVQFTARIHTDLFTKMEKLCISKNVSLNYMLNRIIQVGIARMST